MPFATQLLVAVLFSLQHACQYPHTGGLLVKRTDESNHDGFPVGSGRPAGGRRPAGVEEDRAAASGRVRLAAHRHGFLQNERGSSHTDG